MGSNINVMKDIIDIRDDMEECASVGMNDVNNIINKQCLNWIECICNVNIYFNVPFGAK